MMVTDNRATGFGKIVPPSYEHVRIYFLEKGQSLKDAYEFYESYNRTDWLNNKGHLIKDWKMHAWQWIWNRPIG